MWSDSPGTSVCRPGIFGNRPGLGQCDRPGPGSLPLSHYLWQGIKTMSHLFFIISLVACNQRLEKNLICLLLISLDCLPATSYCCLALVALKISLPCSHPRPIVASLSLYSRLYSHVTRPQLSPRPRRQTCLDNKAGSDVPCQDAVRQRLLKSFAPFELRSSCSSFFILSLHVRMHQGLFTWCSLYNLFLELKACCQYRTTSGEHMTTFFTSSLCLPVGKVIGEEPPSACLPCSSWLLSRLSYPRWCEQ
jgi:hypothetical protein